QASDNRSRDLSPFSVPAYIWLGFLGSMAMATTVSSRRPWLISVHVFPPLSLRIIPAPCQAAYTVSDAGSVATEIAHPPGGPILRTCAPATVAMRQITTAIV